MGFIDSLKEKLGACHGQLRVNPPRSMGAKLRFANNAHLTL